MEGYIKTPLTLLCVSTVITGLSTVIFSVTSTFPSISKLSALLDVTSITVASQFDSANENSNLDKRSRLLRLSDIYTLKLNGYIGTRRQYGTVRVGAVKLLINAGSQINIGFQ